MATERHARTVEWCVCCVEDGELVTDRPRSRGPRRFSSTMSYGPRRTYYLQISDLDFLRKM